MTNATQSPARGVEQRCPHCRVRFGYHLTDCPVVIDEIVETTCKGFKSDLERIMAEHSKTKPGELTAEEQCMMVTEASGWRARALKAEKKLRALTPAQTEDGSVEVERLRQALCVLRDMPIVENDGPNVLHLDSGDYEGPAVDWTFGIIRRVKEIARAALAIKGGE